MMIKGLLCFLVLAVVSACSRQPDNDSTEHRVDSTQQGSFNTSVTQLPPRAATALNQYAPGFVQFQPSEYASKTDTVSRVSADFNGDGLQDVALYGHDKARELLFVLLSSSDSVYRVYSITEMRWEQQPNGVGISLAVDPPGPFRVPGLLRTDSTPTKLKYPALEIKFGQEGSEMHYWNGSRFIKIVTGD